MDLDQYLYDHYESHLAQGAPPSAERYEKQARHYSSVFGPLLPEDKTVPILDIGCGFGHFLYFLRQSGYTTYRGIEAGRRQVEVCHGTVTPAVEHTAAIPYLSSHRAEFGAIVMLNVLEHVPDSELLPLLGSVRDALAPGGRVIVSVPNAACLPTLMTRYGDLTHKRLFSEWSLTQLLDAVGFKSIRLLPHERRVIRSFRSRRERLAWHLRDRFARWLLNELHVHLMEGAVPSIQTVNLIGVGTRACAS